MFTMFIYGMATATVLIALGAVAGGMVMQYIIEPMEERKQQKLRFAKGMK